jgi:hypothetical protein
MIYRSEKGSPLTMQELDGNFKELLAMIQELQQQRISEKMLPESLKAVYQEGDKLMFEGTYSSDLGTVTLPTITPHIRGPWQKEEYYCVHDWVVFEHKTYACMTSHVADDFAKDMAQWRIVIDPKM